MHRVGHDWSDLAAAAEYCKLVNKDWNIGKHDSKIWGKSMYSGTWDHYILLIIKKEMTKNKLPVPLNDEYYFLKLSTRKEEGQGMTNSKNITIIILKYPGF